MMGILAGLFEKRFHVSQEPPGWVSSTIGWETASGVDVSEEIALQYSAVYACVRVLSETVASLPLITYKRRGDGGKERAESFYLYSLLHEAPNPEMTTFQFLEVLMGHLTLWGNAYANIEYNGRGEVVALWPLRPDRVKVARENGNLVYYYRKDKSGEATRLTSREMLHVPGLGTDGVVGLSPIQLVRQTIGLGMATDLYGSTFFGNGARPGMVLQHPGKLSDEAHKRLRQSWEDRHMGVENANRVAVLEEGLTVQEIGIPPEDAQFLETRKFQRNEIAMIFRVPPHMLADLDRATFSNIEHQSIDFVVHTIRPWLVRWEKSLGRSLLREPEKKRYFVEFLVDGLLRGDIQSRYEAYAVARQNGWLSANDVRELENMNPIEGGDVYLIPLNMVPAGSEVEPQRDEGHEGFDSEPLRGEGDGIATPGEDRRSTKGINFEVRQAEAAQGRHRLMLSQRRIFRDVLARILRREKNDLGAAARKFLKDGQAGIAQFYEWLDLFYFDHKSFVGEQLFPVLMAYAELVGDISVEEALAITEGDLERVRRDLERALEKYIREYLEAMAGRNTRRNADKVRKAVQRALDDDDDLVEAVDRLVEKWPEERAVTIADEEAVRSNNAIAELVYAIAGVQLVMWRAFGDSCPYCRQLDGKVAKIKTIYLEVGEFQPEGADRPLTVVREIRHPPAHGGCDCMLVAAI